MTKVDIATDFLLLLDFQNGNYILNIETLKDLLVYCQLQQYKYQHRPMFDINIGIQDGIVMIDEVDERFDFIRYKDMETPILSLICEKYKNSLREIYETRLRQSQNLLSSEDISDLTYEYNYFAAVTKEKRKEVVYENSVLKYYNAVWKESVYTGYSDENLIITIPKEILETHS